MIFARRFNADRYLDQKLQPGATPQPATHPYGWLGRLNDRVERWMDSTDWHRFEMGMGNICGVVLTGAVVWFAYVLAEAVISGAIQRAVR